MTLFTNKIIFSGTGVRTYNTYILEGTQFNPFYQVLGHFPKANLFWKVPAHFASYSGIQASKRLRKPALTHPQEVGFCGFPGHTCLPHRIGPYTSLTSVPQKQAETQKQRIQYQLEQLCQFLEQQEQLFGACLEELGQTIGQVRETYGTRVTGDIALLDKLIGELEAKQCQPEWELMKVSVAGPGLPPSTVCSRVTWAPSTAISYAQASG